MNLKFIKLLLISTVLFFNTQVKAEYDNKCVESIKNKKYYAAIDICKSLAKSGDIASQFNLGTLYYQGLGVMPDNKIAYKWISQAANNNFAKAQYNMGIMTANGIGTETDLAKAYGWLILAKNNSYDEAIFAIEKMSEELSKKEKQQAEKFVQDFNSKLKKTQNK